LSLKDFAKALQLIDGKSIDFHFGRGDFRRWIQFILGDIDLSARINSIPQNTRGQDLREALIETVSKRIMELRKK